MRHILLLGASTLFNLSLSWELDSSCDEYKDYVTAGLQGAFELADAAAAALTANTPAALPADIQQIIRWLFRPEVTVSEEPDPQARSDQNDGNLRIAKSSLNGVFDEINLLNHKDDMTKPAVVSHYIQNPSCTDVAPKLFCNLERFIQRDEDNGRYYDPEMGVVVQDIRQPGGTSEIFRPQDYCKTPSFISNMVKAKFGERSDFAFTMSQEEQQGTFSTITICPWFLDFATDKGFKASYSVETWGKGKIMRGLSLQKRITEKYFTPVDAQGLIDKILLHELSHAIREAIKDVDEFDSYGWENCKRIAGDDVKRYINADSYALFGVCVKLINDGFQINEDGTFIKP